MLNSLLAATGLPARALRNSLSLALLPFAITASPAFAQVSEPGTPTSPIPNGLPQVRETTGKWSLPASPPPNIIELPGVTQADIDRVTAQPQRRSEPEASATQLATATAPLQPVPAPDRYFQNRYVRRIPIYQGSEYQAPLTAATCSYSPSSTFSYQTFSDLNNRNLPLQGFPLQGFPLQGYGDNAVIVTERTVTERTFVLNNSGLNRNQVIVSGNRYPQQLGLSNRRTFARRGSNRFDRLAECGAIERY